MLRAKTQEGEYITLAVLPKQQIEHLRKKQFYCPECKNAVIVRAGPKVIPHFAHKSTTKCTLHGGEGAYHQKGKLLLYDWLCKQNIHTKLETYLPEIGQRPDLLIQIGNRKIAIEYQCSTIPINHIRKRNMGYKRIQITPIWILGAKLLKRKSANHFQIDSFTQQFIQQFSPELPTTLFYFCPLTKTFSLINDIYVTSANRAIANIKFKKLINLPFKHLFSHERYSTNNLFSLWRKEKKKFRLRQSRVFGNELKWRHWLYSKGLYRQNLPSIVYLPVKGQHTMKVPLWNWQSRLIVDYLHLLPIGKTFSYDKVRKKLQPFILQANTNGYDDPIKEYLSLLSVFHIIRNVSDYHYMKTNTIRYYTHINQALDGDDELLRILMYNQKKE